MHGMYADKWRPEKVAMYPEALEHVKGIQKFEDTEALPEIAVEGVALGLSRVNVYYFARNLP